MFGKKIYVLILKDKYKTKEIRNQKILSYIRQIYRIPLERALVLQKDICGKPYISGLELEISITHSGGYLLVAVGKQKIGVDIEQVKPIDFQKVMNYLFTEEEIQFVAEDIRAFYDIWVKKECYTKMLGKGMLMPFQDFSVVNIENATFQVIPVNSKYISYVCYDGKENVQIEIWNRVKKEM